MTMAETQGKRTSMFIADDFELHKKKSWKAAHAEVLREIGFTRKQTVCDM